MTVTDRSPVYDANADLRRLLDAGYEIRFTLPPAPADCSPDAPQYMAAITSGTGSDWRGVGTTPADALRSVWPLGGGHGQGGCGHCGGMGCARPGCAVCAAWLNGQHVSGDCGVCGYADPDGQGDDAAAYGHEDEDDYPEPYCTSCAAAAGIFPGPGDGWHHYRGLGTVESPVELYDAGHEPVIGWREARDAAPAAGIVLLAELRDRMGVGQPVDRPGDQWGAPEVCVCGHLVAAHTGDGDGTGNDRCDECECINLVVAEITQAGDQ